jgi:PAS domain S-box-containing protein
VTWHNVLRRDRDGQIFRMLCSGTDITLRKRMETALAEEKERLAVTLRSIADGVIAADNTGEIRTLNRAAEEYTGWSVDDAAGKPLDTVYKIEPIELKDSAAPPDDRTTGQWKLKSRRGSELIVSQRTSPIYDRESQKIGTVIVFRDITRQFEMREQMERIARLDSIGVLAGGIAHDFNNLLSGLFGYLEMATESDSISEIRDYLEKSNGVYERARNLTGQLLTFSKGGAPVLEVGDIGKVVRDAAMFALSGANVGASFDILEDLWPVAFDAHQMAQVVDNIVINAKQSMVRSGQIRIAVNNVELEDGRVAALLAGKYVHVSVQDSGSGIPQSMIQRIFDPFFTTRKNGTGLGLATSFSIIQRHGGAMDVESEVDKGTTVHLFLPVSAESMKMDQMSADIHHQGNGTVLILDDESFILDIGKKMLGSMGYDVVCFETGNEVIDFIRQKATAKKSPIVAALFDLTIPGGAGGAEIIDEVRELLGDIAIFAVSGYSAGDVMSNPAVYRFTDSLPKPYRKKDLARLLEKYHLNCS